MIRFKLDREQNKPLDVLCLGAHSDDIEIGCGGTLLTLAERYPQIRFHWVVFSAIGIRREEAAAAAHLFAGAALARTVLYEFPDGFLPYHGAEVKAKFEELKREITPDLVLCTRTKDAHQDHRLVSELTWNTFRDHAILEYEIPKYDGDMGRPNFFVPVSEETCKRKIDGLFQIFESQRSKRWFASEMFQGLMRLRGMESNAPSGYAEGFFCRKMVL